MIAIGESIHVLSNKVKEAIANRDSAFIQSLARGQVERGARVLDLNIGPQKKEGVAVMSWMVETVQEAVDVTLSLDSTNAAAVEAGLQLAKKKSIINSTDATPERISQMLPLAAKYDAGIIALTLGTKGLPSTADDRIALAMEGILPAAAEYGVPPERIYFDPLVLTVTCNQDQALHTIEAIRFFKQMSDPPPMTTCGLSNVSNGVPAELRSLVNRVYLTMLMGAGLDTAIMDPLDSEIMNVLRILEIRDDSSPLGRVYLALHDAYAAGEPFDPSLVDTSDPAQRDVLKTIEVLENKWIYADSYLKL